MTENLETLIVQVCKACKETAKFIHAEQARIKENNIEIKGLNNFVTYVDKEAEQKIVKYLTEILPDSGFITEEGTIKTEKKEYTWIIDPLDGTTNFIHGLPCFCISVGLMHNNEIVLGVIYDPNLDECFQAFKDGGAYLNDTKIRVSSAETLAESLLATGFPYYDYGKLDKYINLLSYFIKNTRGVRRFGSAAIDMAYVACGRFSGFYEYGLNPWDVAAGAIIIQEAGGQVSDFAGKNNYIFGAELLASNGKIHKEFLRDVCRIFI